MGDKLFEEYVEKMAFSSDAADIVKECLVVRMITGPVVQVTPTDTGVYRIIARSMVYVPLNSWRGVDYKINSINSKMDAGSFYCDDDGEIIFRSHLQKRNADACALSISIKAAGCRLMNHLSDITKVAEEYSDNQEYRIVDQEANR